MTVPSSRVNDHVSVEISLLVNTIELFSPTVIFPANHALPSQSTVCALDLALSAVPFPTICA